jgi:hypothetical protein
MLFYLEENICNSRPVLRVFEAAGLEYKRHLDLFSRSKFLDAVPDDIWLGLIARNEWILISAHKSTRFELLQKMKLERLRIRQFSFSCDSLSGAEMAEILKYNLPTIEDMCRRTFPPLIASMSKSGINLRLGVFPSERKRSGSSTTGLGSTEENDS